MQQRNVPFLVPGMMSKKRAEHMFYIHINRIRDLYVGKRPEFVKISDTIRGVLAEHNDMLAGMSGYWPSVIIDEAL